MRPIEPHRHDEPSHQNLVRAAQWKQITGQCHLWTQMQEPNMYQQTTLSNDWKNIAYGDQLWLGNS